MSLKSTLEEIEKEKETAQLDLDQFNPKVRPYKKGQIERAKANLEDLYVRYKNEVLNSAVFILVTGSESEKFAEIAKDEYGCFAVDGNSFFQDLVDPIHAGLYLNKSLNSSIFEIVENLMEDKMKSLDVVSYNSLMFNSKYSRNIGSKEELVQVVKDAVKESVGSEIVGLDALERVTKEAVNKKYSSKIVPILIFDKDENFILTLSDSLRTINPRIVRIIAGDYLRNLNINPLEVLEEVNEQTVGNTLKTIATKA